jgi:hypothetical protein
LINNLLKCRHSIKIKQALKKNRILLCGLLAILAVAFTWHVVSWSEQHGKLAMPPDYDDSHSLVEGAVRLLNFQNSGFGAAWDEYRLRNPHSFLHYYWTAALFAVFGIHEAVPYWANAAFILGVLGAFVSMLPRGLPIVWKLVWAAAFLGVPVCFHVVFDFRSEVTMAALLFMGCACALEWTWGRTHSTAWFFATALCFALALAMKPVMFPYQLGMLGLCSMFYLASRCVVQGNDDSFTWPGIHNIARAIAVLCGLWVLVLLPSLPQFVLHARDIFGYILGVAFESDFYKLKEEAQGAQWSYHWLGYSGVWHLGRLNWLLAGALGLGLLTMLIPAFRKWAPDARWASVVFLTLGAFGGIAINSVHQPWFGMTFQLLLTASALSFIAHLFQKENFAAIFSVIVVGGLGAYWLYDLHNRIYLAVLVLSLLPLSWAFASQGQPIYARGITAAGVILVMAYGLTLSGFIFQVVLVVCALSVLAFALRWEMGRAIPFVCTGVLAMLVWGKIQRAPYHDYVARTIQEEGETGLDWRINGPSRVLEVLKANWKSDGIPVVWCANYGWVDGNTISWEAAKGGRAWKVYNMGTIFGTQRNTSSGLELPEYADYIVVPSPGITGEIVTPYGISDWNSIIRARGNWDLLGEVKAPKGNVSVYRNQVSLERRNFSSATEWIKFCAKARKGAKDSCL